MTTNQPISKPSAIDGAAILIVDDEKHIRLMLRTILESEGCVVSEAVNGHEALELLKGIRFDVMILDLNMPVLDGMGVLEHLKDHPAEPAPRVIVLTAYGSISAAVRATRLGAMDFLEKPGSPEEVRESVAAVLREPLPTADAAAVDPDLAGGYEGVLMRARKLLRVAQYTDAEALLMRATDLAEKDPAYFNLVGVIYEVRKQWALARKFYGKAIRANKNYEPAQQNMRRIYELYTLGASREPVALGDGSDIFYTKRSE